MTLVTAVYVGANTCLPVGDSCVQKGSVPVGAEQFLYVRRLIAITIFPFICNAPSFRSGFESPMYLRHSEHLRWYSGGILVDFGS